jgi:hypothetical protein
MQNRKKLTFDVHLNNKNAIDVAQTSHLTPFQVLWLIYSFHKKFIYYWWLFYKNNIFLDKTHALSTYLFKIYWSNISKLW